MACMLCGAFFTLYLYIKQTIVISAHITFTSHVWPPSKNLENYHLSWNNTYLVEYVGIIIIALGEM